MILRRFSASLLARWFSGRPIRQQIVRGEWPGMRSVCVQGVH